MSLIALFSYYFNKIFNNPLLNIRVQKIYVVFNWIRNFVPPPP